MGILAPDADERVGDVRIEDDALSVALMDGRTISVPLALSPLIAPRSSPGSRIRTKSSARTGRLPAPATAFIGLMSTRIRARKACCKARRSWGRLAFLAERR